MFNYLKILLCILSLSLLKFSHAQTPGEIFQDKLYAYATKNPTQTLFIHFDKNRYSSNETCWFAAYIINPLGLLNEVLSISIVNHFSRKIIKTEQFSIVNGYSAGKISFPDSIQTGDYDLIGFTDFLYNKKPIDIFVQPIEVRSNYTQDYSITIKPDTASVPRFLTIKTIKRDLTPYAEVPIDLTVSLLNRQWTSKVITDKTGTYIYTIPDSLVNRNIHLSAESALAKSTGHSAVWLTTNHIEKRVRFFPEGGYLIDGIQSKVGLEITGTDGSTSQVSAVIYSNGTPIDTIQTDEYGMAITKVLPTSNSKLILKIQSGNKLTDFEFPPNLTSGVALLVNTAVLDNKLPITLKSSGKGKYHIIIHNFKETFGVYTSDFMDKSTTTIQVSLDEVPKGLATITVLNDTGAPVAERMFYAHYSQKSDLSITTDKQIYNTGQPINVSITSKTSGIKANGVISLACINSNQVNRTNFADIESYVYINHNISQLVEGLSGLNTKDSSLIEKTLLIKGWRRYNLADLLTTKESDTAVTGISKITYDGRVENTSGGGAKKISTISILKDSTINFTSTDEFGNLSLSNDNLSTNSATGNVSLVVNDNKNKLWTIKIDNPYQRTLLINIDSIFDTMKPPPINASPTKLTTVLGENTAVLTEVTVSSKSLRGNISERSGYHANACGDFICVEGNLNCPVHTPFDRGSHPPVKGKLYHIFAFQGKKVVYIDSRIYSRCTIEDIDKQSASTIIQGIRGIKDYYMPIKNNSLQLPTSTLYWESLKEIVTGDRYDLQIKNTNSSGKYYIIVQGILNNQPVYQEVTVSLQ